ncbi:unnamed protein product [Schistocephalus solidus]|uniref:Proteasome assembly chaperone 3 n=1 Tax=Schistocephalus solidus TaxID=70667 RepID=A0A183TM36_SCHSO|nr:unnamed protein product [Schistocephalus solidus]
MQQSFVSFRGTTVTGICYGTKSNLILPDLDCIEQHGLVDMSLYVVCSQMQIPAVPKTLAKDILQRFVSVFQNGLIRCKYTQDVLYPCSVS